MPSSAWNKSIIQLYSRLNRLSHRRGICHTWRRHKTYRVSMFTKLKLAPIFQTQFQLSIKMECAPSWVLYHLTIIKWPKPTLYSWLKTWQWGSQEQHSDLARLHQLDSTQKQRNTNRKVIFLIKAKRVCRILCIRIWHPWGNICLWHILHQWGRQLVQRMLGI